MTIQIVIKNSRAVSDNTILVQVFDEFFESLVKKRFFVPAIKGKKHFEKSGRSLELGANFGSAFACKSHKTPLLIL